MHDKLNKLITHRITLHQKPLANKRKRVDTGFLFLAKRREQLYRFASERGTKKDVYFKVEEIEEMVGNVITLK